MKKILLLFILVSFCLVPAARAVEVVVVKNYNIKPFNNSLEGFKKGCNCTIKEVLLSNMKPVRLEHKVRLLFPSVILAIGEKALLALKNIKDIPIIYTNVPFPWFAISDDRENVTGVTMIVPPRRQLARLLEITRGIKRVGLVYDPEETGRLVEDAQDAATELGLELIALPTNDSRKAPSLIKGMAKEIDAYWMMPDITVTSSVSVEVLMRLSLENNIPVLTFNNHFVKKGALMALHADDFYMGKQAGAMAKKILTGEKPEDIPRSYANRELFSFNRRVANKLGTPYGKTKIKIVQRAARAATE